MELLTMRHLSGWGDTLVLGCTAYGLWVLTCWYWREFTALRGRARRVRAWRERIGAVPERPFHLRLLSRSERYRLIGRGRVNSEQWFRAVAAEFVAGRRASMPTCGEYLAEFGRHPRVRPAQRV